jgi:glycosyltransferase involved in cell wall biosynthesis
VKIVEAFAARLPVVSTSVGVQGLGLAPGTHYVCGDSPAELAEGLVAVLRSARLAETLERAGRRLAEERWTLEAVAGIQNRLCAWVVEERREAVSKR